MLLLHSIAPLIIAIRAYGKYNCMHHRFCKNSGRNRNPKALQLVATTSQQPKTKPDDAFKILGCCETLRDSKTYRRGSQRNDDIEARMSQQKKLSARQKA